MALTADQKEKIMQARGGEGAVLNATKQFHVVVDGSGMRMILPVEATLAEARDAACQRFGAARVGGVTIA